MRILVDITRAAPDNIRCARVREGLRMAYLAYALYQLHNDVCIVGNYEPPFRDDPRFSRGCFLTQSMTTSAHGKYDLTIVAERHDIDSLEHKTDAVMMVKTSNSTDAEYDARLINRTDGLICFSYHHRYAGHPKLIAVPHGVHDRVGKQLYRDGMLKAYLHDDLDTVRQWYETDDREGICWIGNSAYGRCNYWHLFHESLMQTGKAVRCDVEWTQSVPPGEYLRRLARAEYGLCLPGHIPPSYRFSECVLMGCVPIVNLWDCPYSEPITKDNAVIVDDWVAASALVGAGERLHELRAGMDESYCRGWSPLGQARQVLARLS
jgi:hypothetical protein